MNLETLAYLTQKSMMHLHSLEKNGTDWHLRTAGSFGRWEDADMGNNDFYLWRVVTFRRPS